MAARALRQWPLSGVSRHRQMLPERGLQGDSMAMNPSHPLLHLNARGLPPSSHGKGRLQARGNRARAVASPQRGA